jgi:magnesium and cobalt transporter
MGEQTDTALSSDDEGESSDSNVREKGFFGRLLSAFAPGEAERDAAEARSAPAHGTIALPGMAKLRKLRVDDAAIPKAEIIAVPSTITLDQLIATFKESGLSRLPVYKGTLDNPLGLILFKDLALQFGFADPKPRFQLSKMLRPLLFAPPSMPLGVLLQKMQNERIHMALVIDEYGGVDGLVTIEDLIEQVIGEIDDEHDEAEDKPWVLEKPGVYLVQARAPLEDFEAEIGMRLAAEEEGEEIDTIGGLVFMLAGRVPAKGETIGEEGGVSFEIVDADPRRLERLRVRLPRPRE